MFKHIFLFIGVTFQQESITLLYGVIQTSHFNHVDNQKSSSIVQIMHMFNKYS